MEITTNDDTDKDKDMKDAFEAYADNKNTKKEKKGAKSTPAISLEAIMNPDKKKESDSKKSSILEIIGAAPEEIPKEDKVSAEKSDDDKNETGESQAPLEEITEPEKIEVAQGYIDATSAEVLRELVNAEPESAEEAEAAASQVFLDKLQGKLDSGEELNDDLIEATGAESVEDLDIEIDDDAIEEDPGEAEKQEEDEPEPEETEEEDTTSQTVTPPPSPVTPQPINPTPQPLTPPPPTGPITPPGGPPVSPNTPAINNLNASPQFGANVLNANVVDRRRDAKHLLVGVLVGYMVGRRRGRIKTERRLIPIQNKLEKQIGDLHQKLTSQELKVRKLAALQFEQNQPRSVKQRERISEIREKHSGLERPQETSPISREKFSYDYEQGNTGEKSNDVAERILSPKSVETMTVPLLLSLAETIVIGETSLRVMYENGRLNQNQLRRFVKEYLSGEKIEKIMPELIAGQEKLHEQDLDRLKDDNNDLQSRGQNNSERESFYKDQDNNSSPVTAPETSVYPEIKSVLEDQDQTEQEDSKIPTILLIVLAVITGIVVILVAA